MKLKEILLEDFGLDLPISGGLGNSAEDAIVIHTEDADTASVVAMGIASAIFSSAGVHWQCLGLEPAADSPEVFKFVYGTLELTETDVLQSTRELYFNLGDLGHAALLIQAIPSFTLGEQIPLTLPGQLGFAHLLEVKPAGNDSSIDSQILNFSFPEGSLEITVSAADQAPDEDFLDLLFAQAKLAVASTAKVFNAINTQRVNGYRYLAYEKDGESAMMLVFCAKGHALKATVNIRQQEKALFDAAIETLGLLLKNFK